MVSYSPWATNTQYGDSWVGRGHAVGTKLTVINSSLLASIKANPYFNIGFGLQIQRAEGILSSVADYFPKAPNLGGEIKPGEPEVLLTYKGNAISVSPLFGVFIKRPELGLKLGLSWRPGMQHNSKGKLEVSAVSDPLKKSKAQEFINARKTQLGLSELKFDARLDVPSPNVINIGLSYTP